MTDSGEKITPEKVFSFLKEYSDNLSILVQIINDAFTFTDPGEILDPDSKSIIVFKPENIEEYRSSPDEFYCETILYSLKNENLIKSVTSNVPSDILPRGYSGTLTDYRPNTRKPDEFLYAKEEKLRSMLPRGVCMLELNIKNCPTLKDVVIFGQKKFSGSTLGDDDDGGLSDDGVQVSSNKYFISDPNSSVSVVATEKINGEAAHFSGRFIGNEFYLIAGSKNVHMIFQNEEHINKYTEERFLIAKYIAKCVLKKWNNLDLRRKNILSAFLHLTRVTIVGESKMHNHQHIVHFEGLTEDELIVLSITPPPPKTDETCSFTALPIELTLKFLEKFTFSTPFFEILSPSNVEKDQERIRKLCKTEGRVYYFEDEKRNTIGLLKVKTEWYIHLRALRQQASYRHKVSTKSSKKKKPMEEDQQKARKRLKEIQDWIGTSDEELKSWQNVSDEWLLWLEDEVTSEDKIRTFKPIDIRDNFPIVWIPFVKSTRQKLHKDLLFLNLIESSS